ncbi:MAG TPA: glycosyltransferase family 4 protein [Pyrinomonadaceae bacterium]|nr:glycosyltransferase family 4 protein [Pyrinomonadaceae bacterium]
MRIVLCKGQVLGPISGADETLVTYAVQLQKAGHSVSVLLMYRSAKDDPYAQRLLNSGVPVSWIASKLAHKSLGTARKIGRRLLGTFPSSKQLIRNGARRVATGMAGRNYEQCRDYLKQQNADLMHIITPDPSAMVMIRAGYDAGVPVIYQELGLPYHPPDFASYYREFTSVLSLCSEVAALSPKLVEYCRETLPITSPLSVLPIMSDEISNGNGSAYHANGHVNFGFAARMEELKGPIVLMEAFAATRDYVPEVRLKLAGDGSQRKRVAALARSLSVADHYDYSGVYKRPDERTSFMHDVDVFVMPSFTEGTPNSIVEAMANGKPIIASAVGGIPDMIDHDSGILVPPGDARALAKAMILLAENSELRQRMGQAALARYRTLFSPDAVIPLMLETYTRVATAKRDSTVTSQSTHPWAGCQ